MSHVTSGFKDCETGHSEKSTVQKLDPLRLFTGCKRFEVHTELLAIVISQHEPSCIAIRRDTQTVKHQSDRQEKVRTKVSKPGSFRNRNSVFQRTPAIL
jgi:hypothetical protein